MALFDKWYAAMESRDIDAAAACIHQDYKFIRHQSGTSMNRAEMLGMLTQMFASDAVKVHSHRCLYENDEVLVEHSVMDFPDGSTEAVLTFCRLKDGQFIEAETGATLLKR